MASTAAQQKKSGSGLDRFWHRVTEGMELHQLWAQFQTDARSSYRLYSIGIDDTRGPGVTKWQYFWNRARLLFWAVMDKLSPARRLILLVALIFLVIPNKVSVNPDGSGVSVEFNFRFWAALLLLLLFLLEVADRVVMKRDLQIARDIQGWLLPATAPKIEGLEIAFATRPANTVAGDYYDIFRRPNTLPGEMRYLIAVADVAGKSIPAALLMATFQASLRTLSSLPCSLVELAEGMNSYACTNSQGGARFTTAFLAEFDPASRVLTFVNAGHNPPLLRQPDGKFERLEAGGLPFGIMPFAKYESGSVTLKPGQWLAIYTDGVVEAEDAAQAEYGEERLMSTMASGATLGAQQLLSRIMVDVDFFIGNTPQHDDLTCLLLKTA